MLLGDRGKVARRTRPGLHSTVQQLGLTQIPLGSSRLDSTRLDTFDFVERVEPVERVETSVSSESSFAVRLARHSQNAWARHVERVESCRVETSQVEFGLLNPRSPDHNSSPPTHLLKLFLSSSNKLKGRGSILN